MTGPVPIDPQSISFENLPIGEQLTIWATRMWVRALQDAPALHRSLHDAFAIARVPEGYLAFNKVMTVLSTASEEGIEIGCTCCTGITDDEHVLLGIVAEFQTGCAARAHIVLDGWLPPAAARVAAEYFSEYAMLIKREGLMIRPRQWKRGIAPGDTTSYRIH